VRAVSQYRQQRNRARMERARDQGFPSARLNFDDPDGEARAVHVQNRDIPESSRAAAGQVAHGAPPPPPGGRIIPPPEVDANGLPLHSSPVDNVAAAQAPSPTSPTPERAPYSSNTPKPWSPRPWSSSTPRQTPKDGSTRAPRPVALCPLRLQIVQSPMSTTSHPRTTRYPLVQQPSRAAPPAGDGRRQRAANRRVHPYRQRPSLESVQPPERAIRGRAPSPKRVQPGRPSLLWPHD
jgi:hypothetical protein